MSDNWWRGGVIYQIYPRSFQDTTGNGSGDLNGITQRLDHIADLGADAIWISPFFKSPMKDFGYDVSDYKDIDPSFGTLSDFDILIARAHELGIKIIVDLVLSHTSNEHQWFQESQKSKDNAKSDWYVWAEANPDGTPPNNWLSIFGGSAWEWHGGREQYFLHNFLKVQPDLNFHNVDVQAALLDVAKFWLDRGVDGFRLDTINFYFHDAQLRNNPALLPEDRNDDIAPRVNPYNHQDHLYDKNQPENLEFLKQLRSLMDQYEGRAAVGEVGDAQYGLEIVAQYTSGNDKVHMCYAFDFLSPKPLTAQKIRHVLTEFEDKAPDGWPCWALSNHDVMRHISRLGGNDEIKARLLAALLLSLRGSVSLYQGEELGLPEANIPYDRLQDPYGIQFWPEFKGRDGCRTPMIWENSNTGGFSMAEPWLPIDDRHQAMSVENQTGDQSSILEFYKDMIAFRKTHPVFMEGDIEFFDHNNQLLSFSRHDKNDTIYCCFNLTDQTHEIALTAGHQIIKTINLDLDTEQNFAGGLLQVPPSGAFFAAVPKE